MKTPAALPMALSPWLQGRGSCVYSNSRCCQVAKWLCYHSKLLHISEGMSKIDSLCHCDRHAWWRFIICQQRGEPHLFHIPLEFLVGLFRSGQLPPGGRQLLLDLPNLVGSDSARYKAERAHMVFCPVASPARDILFVLGKASDHESASEYNYPDIELC